MFVRTKKGKIYDCIVGEQMGKPIYYPKTSETNGYIDWYEIYKKSENVIDILETGDYVNGYKVKETGIEELGHTYLSLDMNEDIHWLESEIENEEQIKSIVTKEQFESMSYKLGD